MLGISSSPRAQPATSLPVTASQPAQPASSVTFSREQAAEELTALFQQFHIREGGEFLSKPRANLAAWRLVHVLQKRELDLRFLGPTLTALLRGGADRILPLIERLCQSEAGLGIHSVRLDSGLTKELQAKQQRYLHAGLLALKNLQHLSLQPWEGQLDLLCFPLVPSVDLDMCGAEDNITIDVLAWKGTRVVATWDQRPLHPSRLHVFVHGQPPQLKELEVVIALPSTLLPSKTSTLTAAKPRLTTQQPKHVAQSILSFMSGGAVHPDAVPQQARVIPNSTVVLTTRGKDDLACWIRVNAPGEINVAVLDALDSAEPGQVFYRVKTHVDVFAAELAGLLKIDGVRPPLNQLLDALAAQSVDINGFHIWLRDKFELEVTPR